jgi:ethanolamine utilization microcompartment shell protein EutS
LKQGTTNYGGAYYLGNQAFTLENAMMNYKGVITLLPGEAFVINTDAAVQISGFVRYRVIV